MPRTVMIVAGEASGDLHAANFVDALKRRIPDIRLCGMGGGAMKSAGIEILVDSTDLAVVGLFEVLSRYLDIRRALHRLTGTLDERRPDLLVLVDYVEFNLRLARAAKARGIPVLFYVSPQIWAWRPGRIRRIARVVDMMAVLFPFEEEIYRRQGIPVRYVGNPLVDIVKVSRSRDEVLTGLGLDASRPVLGLLPGSRHGEIQRHLPLLIDTCRLIHERQPQVQFILPVAPGIDHTTDIEPVLAARDASRLIRIADGRAYDSMNACDALVAASGTVTLEAGLLGVPMVIIYRISPISYAILKPLIRIPDIGLVNIVAGRRIVRELVQGEATPPAIAEEALRMLEDREYAERIRRDLAEIRERLGTGHGAENVAILAEEMLESGD